MKGGRPPKGFTIVEVLIVMAVTGALFIGAMTFLSGRQSTADFDDSIRNFQIELQSIVANISNGYTNADTNFTCNYGGAEGTSIVVLSGNSVRGQNKDCIYVGEAIQFSPDAGGDNRYQTLTLAGRRKSTISGALRETVNLLEAEPKVIGPSVNNKPLTGGSKFNKISYNDGGGNVEIGTFAILTTFPGRNCTTNVLENGTLATDLVAIDCTGLGDSTAYTTGKLESYLPPLGGAASTCGTATMTVKNPKNGIHVCITGGKNKYAIITLGGNDQAGGQTGTSLEVFNSLSEVAAYSAISSGWCT